MCGGVAGGCRGFTHNWEGAAGFVGQPGWEGMGEAEERLGEARVQNRADGAGNSGTTVAKGI